MNLLLIRHQLPLSLPPLNSQLSPYPTSTFSLPPATKLAAVSQALGDPVPSSRARRRNAEEEGPPLQRLPRRTRPQRTEGGHELRTFGPGAAATAHGPPGNTRVLQRFGRVDVSWAMSLASARGGRGYRSLTSGLRGRGYRSLTAGLWGRGRDWVIETL